jgi:hypothetical protein
MGSSFSGKRRSGDLHPPAAELVGFRKLVARAMSACPVLRGEKAEGR